MMEDDISRILQMCTLTEEEQDTVTIHEAHIKEGIERCQASIYAKLLTEININTKGFAVVIAKAWGCPEIKINKIGHNQFHIFLPTEEDVKRVETQGPWNFDNHLVLTKPWCWGQKEADLAFQNTKFWIQVRGLPCALMTREVATQIASSFPKSEMVEIREETVEGVTRSFFRIRAMVAVLKPLRRFVQINLNDEKFTGVL